VKRDFRTNRDRRRCNVVTRTYIRNGGSRSGPRLVLSPTRRLIVEIFNDHEMRVCVCVYAYARLTVYIAQLKSYIIVPRRVHGVRFQRYRYIGDHIRVYCNRQGGGGTCQWTEKKRRRVIRRSGIFDKYSAKYLT